ncbi:MAG: triple tyrosine motif-containing protein [Aequoribacter sp.]|uniref:triple tyrosine motif-containing protein n=2 Tax=Aequoribacter sp. TaxID=2847771 RepID=UPI003C3F4842
MNLLKDLKKLNKSFLAVILAVQILVISNLGYSETSNYRKDYVISDLAEINDHLDHRTIIDVAFDPSGSIWILTIDGVFVYNGARLKSVFSREVLAEHFENIYNLRFSENHENILLFDRNTNMNIDTETFSLNEPDYINIASSCVNAEAISKKHVTRKDDSDCLTHIAIEMLGEFSIKDVSRLDPNIDIFATQNGLIMHSDSHGYTLINSSNSTLFDSDVTAVTSDANNNLLVGTYSGLQALNLKSFSFLPKSLLGGDLNSITNIEVFDNELIAILTIDHLDIFDTSWSMKTSIPVPSTAMTVTKSGETLVVGSTGAEHCLLDVRHQPHMCDASLNLSEVEGISSLQNFQPGKIIIGTSINGKIFSISSETKHLTHIVDTEKHTVFLEPIGDSVFISGGIGNLAVTKIQLTEAGDWRITPIRSWEVENMIFYDALPYGDKLFIATSQGLVDVYIDNLGNTAAPELLNEKMVSGKHIFSIEQNSEFIAFTSANQIHMINKQDLSSVESVVVVKDLVRNFEFDFGVSTVRGESFIFGGSAGLVTMSTTPTPTPPPKLNFTSFAVKGEQMKIAAPLHQIQDITLPHDAYHFSAEFAVMDYINPNRSLYKYKLEGLDDDWIDGGHTPSATYTNLSSGEYTLKVIGANADGVWNNEGISIDIIVKAAPWATWWAYTLYASFTIVALWLFKRYYDTVQLQIKAVALSREMVEATEGNTETLYHRIERFKQLLSSRDDLFQSVLAEISTLSNESEQASEPNFAAEHLIKCTSYLHERLISQRADASYYVSELVHLAFEQYHETKPAHQPKYIPLVDLDNSALEVHASVQLYAVLVGILEWLPDNYLTHQVISTAVNIKTLNQADNKFGLLIALGHALDTPSALLTDRLLQPLVALGAFSVKAEDSNPNQLALVWPKSD